MTTLRFMGLDEPETFRCRIYGDGPVIDAERTARAFVNQLAVFWVETEESDPPPPAPRERSEP